MLFSIFLMSGLFTKNVILPTIWDINVSIIRNLEYYFHPLSETVRPSQSRPWWMYVGKRTQLNDTLTNGTQHGLAHHQVMLKPLLKVPMYITPSFVYMSKATAYMYLNKVGTVWTMWPFWSELMEIFSFIACGIRECAQSYIIGLDMFEFSLGYVTLSETINYLECYLCDCRIARGWLKVNPPANGRNLPLRTCQHLERYLGHLLAELRCTREWFQLKAEVIGHPLPYVRPFDYIPLNVEGASVHQTIKFVLSSQYFSFRLFSCFMLVAGNGVILPF